MTSAAPLVMVVSALPPPVHGQSKVTAGVVEALRAERVDLVVVDTSPRSLRRGLRYHARKAFGVASATVLAAVHAFRSSKRLYCTLDAGLGILYNYLLFAVFRLLNFRIFVHHHTSSRLRSRGWATVLALRLAGRRATHVVLSAQMASELTASYPFVCEVRICGNALHAAPPAASRRRSRVDCVGTLGNLSFEKGLDLVLETQATAQRAGLGCRLRLAGPLIGEAASAIVQAAGHELGERLAALGPVDGREKDAFFDSIDLFLFPSRYRHEAQPVVLLEAMAHGVPVIATDVGYIRELVGDGGYVIESDADYPSAAVDLIRRLSASPAAMSRAAEASRRRFDELADVSRVEFAALVSELCGRMAPRPAQRAPAGFTGFGDAGAPPAPTARQP